MSAADAPEDAVALAKRVDKTSAREVLVRAQADMLLWAFERAPAMVKAWPPHGPWGAAVHAVQQVVAGEIPDVAVLLRFHRWIVAQNTDWATREALHRLYDGVESVLGPFTGGEPEPDVESMAAELVHAAGLWAWDELLSEASEFGDTGGEQAAQEAVRERDERDAHAALAAILRKHVAAASDIPVVQGECGTGKRE